jgi:hypothetical protein
MRRRLACACLLLTAGCSRPQAAAPLDASVQPLAPDATPTVERVPAPGETPSGEAAPSRPACVNDARFLEDLTVPDGTVVAPGEAIDKRWSVRNAGTCDWGPGYRLLPVDAGGLLGPAEVALYPALAGATATLQVALQAPVEPGLHTSIWRAQAPDGTLFGDTVYLVIDVEPGPEVLLATSAVEPP